MAFSPNPVSHLRGNRCACLSLSLSLALCLTSRREGGHVKLADGSGEAQAAHLGWFAAQLQTTTPARNGVGQGLQVLSCGDSWTEPGCVRIHNLAPSVLQHTKWYLTVCQSFVSRLRDNKTFEHKEQGGLEGLSLGRYKFSLSVVPKTFRNVLELCSKNMLTEGPPDRALSGTGIVRMYKSQVSPGHQFIH
ncbi:hypothetical protein LZ30DRAFT_364839 [Colletotrichum cereale]|nr:hypothetical protein LZ30DRAFT_364839 [Colletotrichum cereale]